MNIEAHYFIERGDFTLDAAFAAPARGVTALFGPSGCGKTTLLRAIAGLEHCPGGSLSVSGEVWQDEHSFLPPHRRPVGYVFQEASLFPHLSVAENIGYGLRRRSKPAVKQAVADLSSLGKAYGDAVDAGDQEALKAWVEKAAGQLGH